MLAGASNVETEQVPKLEEPSKSDGRAYGTLIVLSVVYGLAGLDRIAIGLLADPIKHELGLSDAQLGIITGLAFTLFYVTLALPIGRYADRANRKNVIIVSILLFSLATALCGLAVGFFSLLLARLLVGIGEAGPLPASISIISSSFQPKLRPFAIAVHSAGGLLGVGLALIAIAMLADAVSWREILYLSGALGVLVCMLVAIVVKEPAREARQLPHASLLSVMSDLARNPSYRWMSVGMGFSIMIFGSATSWIPSMLTRSFGYERSETTLFMALGVGLGGAAGSVLVGYLTTLIRKGGGVRPLLLAAFVNVAIGIGFMAAFAFSPRPEALALLIVALMLAAAPIPTLMALVQELVPPERRAITTAITVLIGNAIGYGLGPVLTGLLSDWLLPQLGKDSVRLALGIVIGGAAMAAAVCCINAARRIIADSLIKQST